MAKNADGQLELVLENRQLLLTFFVIVALCGVFFSLGYIVGRNTFNSVVKAPQTASASADMPAKPSPMPHAPQAAHDTPTPASAEGSPEGQGAQTDLNFYQSVEQKSPDGKLVPPEAAAAQAAATGGTAGGTSGAAAPHPQSEKSATQALPPTPPAAQAAPAVPPPPAPQPAASAGSSTPNADGILIQVSALTRREDALTLVNLLRERKLPVQVMPGSNDTLYHVVVGPFKYIKDAEHAKEALEKDGFRPIYRK